MASLSHLKLRDHQRTNITSFTYRLYCFTSVNIEMCICVDDITACLYSHGLRANDWTITVNNIYSLITDPINIFSPIQCLVYKLSEKSKILGNLSSR